MGAERCGWAGGLATASRAVGALALVAAVGVWTAPAAWAVGSESDDAPLKEQSAGEGCDLGALGSLIGYPVQVTMQLKASPRAYSRPVRGYMVVRQHWTPCKPEFALAQKASDCREWLWTIEHFWIDEGGVSVGLVSPKTISLGSEVPSKVEFKLNLSATYRATGEILTESASFQIDTQAKTITALVEPFKFKEGPILEKLSGNRVSLSKLVASVHRSAGQVAALRKELQECARRQLDGRILDALLRPRPLSSDLIMPVRFGGRLDATLAVVVSAIELREAAGFDSTKAWSAFSRANAYLGAGDYARVGMALQKATRAAQIRPLDDDHDDDRGDGDRDDDDGDDDDGDKRGGGDRDD